MVSDSVLCLQLDKNHMAIINPADCCSKNKFCEESELRKVAISDVRLLKSFKNNIIAILDEEILFIDTMTNEINFELSFKNQFRTVNATLICEEVMVLATEKGLFTLNLGAYNLNAEVAKMVCEGRFYKVALSPDERYIVAGGFNTIVIMDSTNRTIIYSFIPTNDQSWKTDKPKSEFYKDHDAKKLKKAFVTRVRASNDFIYYMTDEISNWNAIPL
jgi:hypothetical protein